MWVEREKAPINFASFGALLPPKNPNIEGALKSQKQN
jgi:hypothetical protein